MATIEDFGADARYPDGAFTGASNCVVSPSGAQVALVHDLDGTLNLYVLSADGSSVQVTDFTDRGVRGSSWHPDGRRLFFTADHDGDEQQQIYVADLDSGAIEAITERPTAMHSLPEQACSPDGTWLAYYATAPDPEFMSAWLYNIDTGEHRVVTGTTKGRYFVNGWSPDSSLLVAAQANDMNTAWPVLIDVARGEVLAEYSDLSSRTVGLFPMSADDVIVQTGQAWDFSYLAVLQPSTGVLTPLVKVDREIDSPAVSADGSTLAWVVNEDGYGSVQFMRRKDQVVTKITGLPTGSVHSLSISADGGTLACLVDGPTDPVNAFLVDTATSNITQLTANAVKGVSPESLVAPELIRYPAEDGKSIPAFVYKPTVPSPRADGKYPVVVYFHGGPQAQELPRYVAFYQLLASRGIGVIAPNIRGSAGYGTEYRSVIDRNWGITDLADFAATHDAVCKMDWVATERIGVFGRSYGGFAALTCMTRMPDQWAVGVAVVGPANLVTFTKSIPESWKTAMAQQLGDPDVDRERFVKCSPITYAQDVKSPLFVIQGAKDPRVVKAESDQMVAKIREAGIDVRYDVYHDEGHLFIRKDNEVKYLRDSADFLSEHLLG